ncbi:MAG: hypothetical protein KF722_09185 [Nitrospira sp.]|nr:hypothetical protein [Nitrospira sp.]
MKAINYFYLEDQRQWLDYLQDYPDYEKEAECTFHPENPHVASDLIVSHIFHDDADSPVSQAYLERYRLRDDKTLDTDSE